MAPRRRMGRKRAAKKGRWSGPRRMSGPKRQQVHYFKRSAYAPAAVIATGGATNYFALAWNLAGLPDFTDFSSLYDQYKIRKVKVQFMPRGNSSDSVTGNAISSLFTVLDFDDSNPPTSVEQLLQYDTLKVCRSTQQQTRLVVPKFNKGIINTVAGGLIGKNPSTGYIDLANSSVAHYGIKGALTVSTAGTIVYDVVTTFYLAMKHVR